MENVKDFRNKSIYGSFLLPDGDDKAQLLNQARLVIGQNGEVVRFEPVAEKLPSDIQLEGVITPSFRDLHTHIPQFYIRGGFLDGVPETLNQNRLLAGLSRNVFPEEAKAGDCSWAMTVSEAFLEATAISGVTGGCTYMTVHPNAAKAAIEVLPADWKVGLVLMDQNCPEYLKTDLGTVDRHLQALAEQYGSRLVITDRFAVATSSGLRRKAADIARRYGLWTQTHLNEQIGEKAFVRSLYPDYDSYTDVYRKDGLLDSPCILAHCIYMEDEEWKILRDQDCHIAHCPVSNTLLGSGLFSLDRCQEEGVPVSLCTDVGASPSTDLLVELSHFLSIHRGINASATAEAALGMIAASGFGSTGTHASFVHFPDCPTGQGIVAALHHMCGLNEERLNRYTWGNLKDARTRLSEGCATGNDLKLFENDVRLTMTINKSIERTTYLAGVALDQNSHDASGH